MANKLRQQYKEILNKYLHSQSEEDLYVGQQFSRKFLEKDISPEEVISIHKLALCELCPTISAEIQHSFDFLIEMMIHYGLAHREHQSLIRKQEAMQLEMNVARKMQETLLKTKTPTVKGLDIGWLSEPAHQMNGDYIYFLNENEEEACIAIADIIGKGIPAALCMSMIKFGMDGLDKDDTSPMKVLSTINKIVGRSLDESMFVSMFYGKYTAHDGTFSYASAGHEPALYFHAQSGKFTELNPKGLLLGVQPNVSYEERSVQLKNGDFIVMMTDGVTETRTEDGFIEIEFLQQLLEEVKDQSATSIVKHVYRKLGAFGEYRLNDDFTIIIIKKIEEEV